MFIWWEGEDDNAHKILVRKSDDMKPSGRTQISCDEAVDLALLMSCMAPWWPVVGKEMERRILWNAENFFYLILQLIVFVYQLYAQILYFNKFIIFLFMFRALLCSSSGGQLY